MSLIYFTEGVEKMLNLLQTQKPLTVNGIEFESVEKALQHGFTGTVNIVLNRRSTGLVASNSITETRAAAPIDAADSTVYRVTVKQYMTRQSTPEFNFHDKWNQGNPMPMRTMEGTVLQETNGMVKMKLHGAPNPTSSCLKCGKTLTHSISLIVGLGPECGGHAYDIGWSEEQVLSQMESIKAAMAKIEWTGWIIKSAITNKEVVTNAG